MEWLIKLLVVLMIAPFVVCLALQLAVAVMGALLPWVLVVGAIAGIAAGVSAALVLRRRLPVAGRTTPLPPGAPPLGAYRVRRPRGGRTRS